MSYINRLRVDSTFKELVHFFSVADNVNGQVELFFKILFDADQVEKILIFKQHDDINIAALVESIFDDRTEKPDFEDVVFPLIFLFISLQGADDMLSVSHG